MNKKIILSLLSIFGLCSLSYADSPRGMYIGGSAGLGITNTDPTVAIPQFPTTYQPDFAWRADIGGKMDTFFGAEVGFVQPQTTVGSNWLIDVYLNYYMDTSSKWDVIWGIGPYYTNQNSSVGITGQFGLNYNFARNTAVTFGEYLYVNPNVPGNRQGEVTPYLLNNVTTIGMRFMM